MSVSVCPLNLHSLQKFNFSSLVQMYIDRGSGISINNFDSLLVNIPHVGESVVLECPPGRARRSVRSSTKLCSPGHSFPPSGRAVEVVRRWKCQTDGSLQSLQSPGLPTLSTSRMVCLAPCPPDPGPGLASCVCGPEVCRAGELCQSGGCRAPCENPALRPHLNILANTSESKLTGSHHFTCREGFSIYLGEVRLTIFVSQGGKFSSQAGRTEEVTASCLTGQSDSHWVVGGTPTQMACQDSRKCQEPPPHSDLLTSDFDHFKMEPGDTFSLSCLAGVQS